MSRSSFVRTFVRSSLGYRSHRSRSTFVAAFVEFVRRARARLLQILLDSFWLIPSDYHTPATTTYPDARTRTHALPSARWFVAARAQVLPVG